MRPLSLSVALLVLFSACQDSERALPTEPQPPTATTATVTGRVLSLENGQPVANAIVAYIGPSESTTTTTAGSDGTYALRDLPPVTHSITVNGKGAGQVLLAPGVNVRDVFVAGAGCVVQYGTVRDAGDGHPIAGAKVTIYGRETTTAADGTYAIDFGCNGMVNGSTILITASAPGYRNYQSLTRASALCTCSIDIKLERM